MAKATQIPEVVKVVEPEKVILELSRDEAQFLANVLGAVGGDPDKSPRRHQRGVSGALEDLGIYSQRTASGSIYFRFEDLP